ncbi:MAG: diacylglycerol kinase [Thiotrichales bacterium]
MKNQPFITKLANAWSGICFTFRTENNFRVQTIIALLTLFGLVLLQPALLWWALIVICIGLVLAGELANTALETLIDHIHPEQHPLIGKAKDIMAGMVLTLSITTVVVAVLALVDTLKK